jgi:hypothetical protein
MSLRRRSGGYPWEGFDIFLNRVVRGSEKTPGGWNRPLPVRPELVEGLLSTTEESTVVELSSPSARQAQDNEREGMGRVVNP